MRTRGSHRSAPEPGSPYDEIIGGLWMGGHLFSDPEGRSHRVVVDRGFDLVVSLVDRVDHGPPAGVDHRVVPIPDDPLTSAQLDAVVRIATVTADAIRRGQAVLVRCHFGYNRSGLVVAQALVELGHEPADAIALIRDRRSPWALHNSHFEQYLLTGLGVASLLNGLAPPQ